MNGTATRTTVRTLLIAAPLALGALTLTAAPALAAPVASVGPTELVQPEHDEPPAPNPGIPPGPDDIVYDVPDCNNPDNPFFPCPDDEDDDPGLNPDIPPGPGDITSHPPCPTHGDCGGDSGTDGTDGGTEGGGEPEAGDIPVPTRIDTGAGGGDGLELSWVLASGAVLTATAGAAGLTRRAARSRR